MANRREYERAKAAAARAWLDQYKLEKGCADCGYRANPVALEFDHLDPSLKVAAIARLLGRKRFSDVLVEIAKCEVVCSNCHQIRTHNRRSKKPLVYSLQAHQSILRVMQGLPPQETALERLMRQVEIRAGCWVWIGASHGTISLLGKSMTVRLAAYETVMGTPLPGMNPIPSCGLVSCINPAHQKLVSEVEKRRIATLQGWERRSTRWIKTHCPQGHPYEGDNVKIRKGGGRRCLTCQRARNIARRKFWGLVG